MRLKKLLAVMVAVGALSLLLVACFVESDPDDIPLGKILEDSSGKAISGTAKSTENGYLSDIEVTLTVKDGYITEVSINGPGDAASIGSEIIKRAPDMIRKANSFDIDALASVSPAVFTKEAIRKAGNKALAKITNSSSP
jgi:uncharacterized protein with FMN-binding domain